MTQMKEIDFIKDVLKDWVKQFDGIHLKYAYEEDSEFHVIEVEPESVTKYGKIYKEAERKLWKDFMMQFPDSDLLISEPCRTNDMSNIFFNSEVNENVTLKKEMTVSTPVEGSEAYDFNLVGINDQIIFSGYNTSTDHDRKCKSNQISNYNNQTVLAA